MNKERKQLCLNYLKARQAFLGVANNDKVLHGNDNIIGRIGEAVAHSFLEQEGRKPEIVVSKSNPGFDIICRSDGAKISVKMITSENKWGRTSKIRHKWNELVGIELDEDLKVKYLGCIKRKDFDEFMKKRNRSLEPNFSRAMFKENGLFSVAGKLYSSKEIEQYELI